MAPQTKKINKWLPIAGLLLLVSAVSGCSLTKIDRSFPLFEKDTGATLYWIRPNTERPMGIADNAVLVEMNNERLMKLGKGEYTKVQVVPRDYTITLRNQTEVGPHWHIKKVKKSSKWEFEPGETYYLAVKAVDGEFRGVKFQVELLSEYDARAMMAVLIPRF